MTERPWVDSRKVAPKREGWYYVGCDDRYIAYWRGSCWSYMAKESQLDRLRQYYAAPSHHEYLEYDPTRRPRGPLPGAAAADLRVLL